MSEGGRVINSVLEGAVSVAAGAVVQHCHLQVGRSFRPRLYSDCTLLRAESSISTLHVSPDMMLDQKQEVSVFMETTCQHFHRLTVRVLWTSQQAVCCRVSSCRPHQVSGSCLSAVTSSSRDIGLSWGSCSCTSTRRWERTTTWR